jgi:hypothetical protein
VEDQPQDLAGIPSDKLSAIFHRQRSLMEKYELIEEKNGLLQTKDIPINLHDKMGQARLKDFAWRITEELAEAMEAALIHPELVDHMQEEVADALHFLTEFTILAGVTPEELFTMINGGNHVLVEQKDMLDHLFHWSELNLRNHRTLLNYPSALDLIRVRTAKFTQNLGCTCNTLKNKPWKNTHMLTDINLFKKHLCATWEEFIYLCLAYDIDCARLSDLYFKKNQVNQFRIRSNY